MTGISFSPGSGPCRGVWTRRCKFGMRSAPGWVPDSEGFLLFFFRLWRYGREKHVFQTFLKLLSAFEHLRFISQLFPWFPRKIFRIKESRGALHAMHAWVMDLCTCNTLYRKELLSVFCKIGTTRICLRLLLEYYRHLLYGLTLVMEGCTAKPGSNLKDTTP